MSILEQLFFVDPKVFLLLVSMFVFFSSCCWCVGSHSDFDFFSGNLFVCLNVFLFFFINKNKKINPEKEFPKTTIIILWILLLWSTFSLFLFFDTTEKLYGKILKSRFHFIWQNLLLFVYFGKLFFKKRKKISAELSIDLDRFGFSKMKKICFVPNCTLRFFFTRKKCRSHGNLISVSKIKIGKLVFLFIHPSNSSIQFNSICCSCFYRFFTLFFANQKLIDRDFLWTTNFSILLFWVNIRLVCIN